MTELLARFSARRPLATLALWVALVIISLALIDNLLGSATTTELKLSGGTESQRAAEMLEDRLRPKQLIETVIVQSETLTVDDPEFRQEVETVFGEITGLGAEIVAGGEHYYLAQNPQLVSLDRKTTIIPLFMAGSFGDAVENVDGLLHVVETANESPDFRVLIAGESSISYEANELAEKDLQQGESIGIPVALIILLVLFGAVVAALAPVGVAAVAIIIALGLTALIGQVFELVFFVQMMITMIGLAVGIDYSLFIISRFREEINRGLTKLEAVERAGATAGRTVLFSGVTVVVALTGMLIVPSSFFQSLGVGAILVVIVAVLASLTLLPAALSLLGAKINLLTIPFIGRGRSEILDTNRHGFWEVTTRIVTKFPIVSILAVSIPMIAATFFYFQIQTGLNGVDTFPEGTQTREAFFVLEDKFSFGLVDPVEIVIDGDIDSPQVQGAIQALKTALQNSPSFPIPPSELLVNPTGDLALLTVAVSGQPRSQATVEVVTGLRQQIIPAAFDGVPAQVYVGGVTAEAADFFDIAEAYTPIVFAFVLSLSFIILMLVFRSIVIAVKAIVMNLLSVGAAYGLLVLVFQKGGADVLPFFRHAEVIDAWIPLFLFSILFGLSMDYHVFLLSRVREHYDLTGDNTKAVAYGLRSTAGLITGAALIMVVVFAGFASGKTIVNQQVGFGLAIAIFLDATLVRSILVPASMEVLGKANWYLPPFLRWLPDMRVKPSEH